MELFVLGLNHKTAPLKIRERFALDAPILSELLHQGTRLPHVEELVALSTCNRVELYSTSRHPEAAKQQLLNLFTEIQKIEVSLFQKHSYFYQGKEAIRHGFNVASSLDSMVLGEAQILGQVKEAYHQALEAGSTGVILNKFFHHCFNTAKKVRTHTGIAQHPVSVSYAGVTLAKQIFGDLSTKRALLLGAGKMSSLAIKHLQRSGMKKFLISNRSEDRAQSIVENLEAQIIPFDSFHRWLNEVDVVISSTNAQEYLIQVESVRSAMQQRKNQPLFFIDLAVPRDISPQVNQLPNVFLYDVDDLGQVVEANRDERLKEARRGKILIDREVEQFGKTLKTLQAVPTLSSLNKKFEKICQLEIDKAFQKLPQLDAEGKEHIERMAEAIMKKILHDPMVMLKEEMPEESSGDYLALVRKLFRLDERSA